MMTAEQIEVRAIGNAYNELKCLDHFGRMRACRWLMERFADEERQGKITREQAARDRIADKAKASES